MSETEIKFENQPLDLADQFKWPEFARPPETAAAGVGVIIFKPEDPVIAYAKEKSAAVGKNQQQTDD